MKRRDFIKTAGGVTAGAMVAPSLLAKAGSEKKPNLLVIMTDEHSFRTLGCYRDTLKPEQAFMWGKGNIVETPHIDAIAKQGVLCTNFYSTSPVCSPARGTFMSGLYPQNTPVVTNDISMKDEIVTFASILGQNGYKTGYAGKWHLDGHGKPQWGPKRQFGFADNRFMFNRGHWKVLEDGPDGPRVKTTKNGKPTYDITGADEKSFTTDWLADKTIEFIEQNKDQPFCYMISIPDPHGPDKVRAPYDKMYTHMKFETPRTAGKKQKGVPTWAQPKRGGADHAQYFGMVKCIDDNVSKMMKALEKCGILDDTIVVFTADHGDLRGEHDRQNKGTVLEASAKVPFIVRYPKLIQAGKLVREAMGGVDFLPTILSLLGVKTTGKEEGRDTSILLTGKKPADWNDVAVIRGTGNLNWVSAITERYKFVISPQDEPWLIDKVRDPDELVNFCPNPEYKTIVKKLANDVKAYGEKHQDPSLKSKKLMYDLSWAVSGTSAYSLEDAPAVPQKGEGKSKKAKKKKK